MQTIYYFNLICTFLRQMRARPVHHRQRYLTLYVPASAESAPNELYGSFQAHLRSSQNLEKKYYFIRDKPSLCGLSARFTLFMTLKRNVVAYEANVKFRTRQNIYGLERNIFRVKTTSRNLVKVNKQISMYLLELNDRLLLSNNTIR